MRAIRCSTAFRVTLSAFLVAVAPALAAPAATLNDSFLLSSSSDALFWEPQVEYDSVVLVVSGPGDFQVRKVFNAGETPYLNLFDLAGNALEDGAYTYELRATPVLTAAQKAALRQAREVDDSLVRATLARELPQGAIQAGYFGVMGQEFLTANLDEAPTLSPTRLNGSSPATAAGDAAATGDSTLIPMAGQVVLTNGDGVIRNSLCVGFDCPDAPVFSDSTILLMENNTRIKFGDTSNSPFPNNDWEIEANSSLSGGQNYLGFNDCGTADNDGGCATDLVFAVESGARQNALYVESDGDIGIGTSNPVVDIHVVTGNTPTLRLDQDGSSGFAPQVWDVAGNETNFFIRDVTGGSLLPFRIRPGAPTSSIDIASSGNVGIGTASPSVPLQVVEGTGSEAERTVFKMENNGVAKFDIQDSSADGSTWTFETEGPSFRMNKNGTGAEEVIVRDRLLNSAVTKSNNTMVVDGGVAAAGFNVFSSREFKTDFTPVDPKNVLADLMNLTISLWKFKTDASGQVHIGPVAEDFNAAFRLGEGRQLISSTDIQGVALAAIQGLHQELLADREALQQEVLTRDAQIEELRMELNSLRTLIQPPADPSP